LNEFFISELFLPVDRQFAAAGVVLAGNFEANGIPLDHTEFNLISNNYFMIQGPSDAECTGGAYTLSPSSATNCGVGGAVTLLDIDDGSVPLQNQRFIRMNTIVNNHMEAFGNLQRVMWGIFLGQWVPPAAYVCRFTVQNNVIESNNMSSLPLTIAGSDGNRIIANNITQINSTIGDSIWFVTSLDYPSVTPQKMSIAITAGSQNCILNNIAINNDSLADAWVSSSVRECVLRRNNERPQHKEL
jgi:hypothetical protein